MKQILAAALVALNLVAAGAIAQDRSTQTETKPYTWSIGGFPFYGALVTPNDSTDLPEPGYLRVDADGQVTAACVGNGTSLTLNLTAGEFFPCQVSRVFDTGTDAITIHVFY